MTLEGVVARLQGLGLSVDRAVISRVGQGTRPVYDFGVVALAKALKVSIAWLIEKAK